MFYIVVHELNKVIAWSNKCGGSSMRRQVVHDLNRPEIFEEMKSRGVTTYQIISQRYPTNPKINTVPMHYKFEWYVRDPFYRTLSCYINRKIIIEGGDLDITFKDFVFNLGHFRSISSNIKSHTEPQTKNFFNAPWTVIDINTAKFSFNQKMNSTKYTLGDKTNAWNIPAKDVVIDNCTYSPVSFYSQEILDAIKTFYADDYVFLANKIHLI
jgi:hypothetical protein